MRRIPQSLQFTSRMFFRMVVIVTVASGLLGLSTGITEAITIPLQRHSHSGGKSMRKYLSRKPDKLKNARLEKPLKY